MRSKDDLWKGFGFSTRSVHAGQDPDRLTGAVSVPIYQTSTFIQESPGRTKGYEYSRTQNPTREALEKSIASLENGKWGLAFSSGMSAISSVGGILRSGDRVLACDDIYGGTYRVFTKVFSNFGIKIDFVDATNLSDLDASLEKRNYSLLLLESPTNPLMKVIDIKEASALGHKFGAKVVVDNTFASPYLQNPLDLDADIVVHSTTKYISGHSDIVGGLIATNDSKIFEQLKFLQNSLGAIPGPFDCWLALRGIKTLALRMDRHCLNAKTIAQFLADQIGNGVVRSVHYPGLRDNQYYEIAKKQMRDFGGMLSIEMNSNWQAIKFLENLRVIELAESLGGVESLIEQPASMTHASIPKKERMKKGISMNLLRISMGIEDTNDLLDDISNSLRRIR
jgi:cystathionine gamma-lyase